MTTLANTDNTLSSKVTGKDFFTCYRSRMKVNNDYFLQIAKELTYLGHNVFTNKDGLISWLRVEKDRTHINFGFNDTPYCWYLSYDIDYKQGQGSGRTLKTQSNYDSPFTADDIIASLKIDAPKIVESSKYLKLFTV